MASRRGGFSSLLVGVDGSRHAKRAVSFVASLVPPSGGRVTVLRVVEPVRLASVGLFPRSVRSQLAGEASDLSAARVRTARRDVEWAVARLKRSGWRARGEVRLGVPQRELLSAVGPNHADLLVVGARGRGAVERFFLGSVAETVTKRAPISVLIVK